MHEIASLSTGIIIVRFTIISASRPAAPLSFDAPLGHDLSAWQCLLLAHCPLLTGFFPLQFKIEHSQLQ